MKRFHVHVSVGDLNQSIQFYTELSRSRENRAGQGSRSGLLRAEMLLA